MVEHTVWFKWKEDAEPAAIETVVKELRALKGAVPGILDLSCGEDFSGRSQGFTHGLVVRFTDKEALEAYGPHPAHDRVVQTFIKPIVAEVIALDYEF